MSLKLNLSLRTSRLQLLLDAIDADAQPGYVEFYTASQPGTAGAAITSQTLLGTCTFSKPAGTITGATLTFDSISEDASPNASDTIAWGRVYDGAGNFVFDADAGLVGSGAFFEFNTLDTNVNSSIKVNSGVINEGNV